MKKHIALTFGWTVAGILILGTTQGWHAPQTIPAQDTAVSASELPPCAYEDGSASAIPCHWDASAYGNGTGTSVVITVAP